MGSIIELKGITKRFPGIVANDHISIALKRERSIRSPEKTERENLR